MRTLNNTECVCVCVWGGGGSVTILVFRSRIHHTCRSLFLGLRFKKKQVQYFYVMELVSIFYIGWNKLLAIYIMYLYNYVVFTSFLYLILKCVFYVYVCSCHLGHEDFPLLWTIK